MAINMAEIFTEKPVDVEQAKKDFREMYAEVLRDMIKTNDEDLSRAVYTFNAVSTNSYLPFFGEKDQGIIPKIS